MLYALDIVFSLPASTTKGALIGAMNGRIIGQTELGELINLKSK